MAACGGVWRRVAACGGASRTDIGATEHVPIHTWLLALIRCEPHIRSDLFTFERIPLSLRTVRFASHCPDLVPDILAQLQASIADRYTVERELGRGGMATVYLATDVRHDRRVAIKVLHPDLGATIGGERFEREIRVAAKLQHPHILGLHDSGQAGELLYYVMPFVEGESVRDRLDREKQLPIDDAIQITLEVADALGYAHAQGIVHRDIKPENVMLSNGHALVADFGIARARSEAGQSRLTQTGMAVGTPVYMSPEQSTGETVTPTADIYSLGCMLYEMLAGEPPFSGANALSIMAKHALEAVPSIRVVRASVPEEVEEAIFAAMEKSPADRPRTISEFCDILGTPMGATATRRVTMRQTVQRRAHSGAQRAGSVLVARRWWMTPWAIAGAVVLLAGGAGSAWFASRRATARVSADPLARRVAVRYFTAGSGASEDLAPAAARLTESLIDELSTSRVLTVISANGVAQFTDADVPRDSVARALRVGTLVEGTVESEGSGGVRITVRLYDASGANLGSARTLTVSRNSLFAAGKAVTRDVSAALRQVIGQEIEVREAQLATSDLTAWTQFNRAEQVRKAAMRLGSAESKGALAKLDSADALLRAASAADPRWIQPAVQRVQVLLDRRRFSPPAEVGALMDTARVRAAEALSVDANSAKALELLGTVKYEQWKAGRRTMDAPAREALLTEAENDLLAAIRKDDRLVSPYATLSLLYYDKKDVPAALLKAQTAYQADEFLTNSQVILSRLFFGSYDTQLFADAKRWCDEGAQRFPRNVTFTLCRLWMQIAPDATPDPAGAWQLAARVDSLAPPASRELTSRIARMLVGGAIGKQARTLAPGSQQKKMLDSARSVLERAQADRTVDPGQELPGYRAVMLAQIGDLDEAVTLLTSYVAANPDHSFRVGGNVHWWWRDLRNKRGFEALLARTR